ncbi:MAG: lysylphosphatidylglycerol synthase transmembrane domain-containing protein [Polyangiales bacterium]
MKGKSRVRSVMRLLGPVLLVWIIWRFADLPVLVDTFAHAAPGPIIAAILLNAIVIHAKLWRWRDLLGAVDVPLGIAQAYRAFLPSLYLGLLTPGRVGDALRIQYLKRDHAVGYSDGLAVSIVDRLCDVYVLLAFVAFGVARLTSAVSTPLAQTTWVAVVVVALAPALLFVRSVAEPAAQWLYGRFADGKTHEGLSTFFAALRRQLGPRLLGPVLVTFAAFLFNYLQAWLVAQAFGIGLAFVDVAALVAISSFLSLLPISISGVGVRESFFALVFPALGFAGTLGIAFGLGVFGVIYLPTLLVGFVAWLVWPPSS